MAQCGQHYYVMYRSGGTVAVAGSCRGDTSCADGRVAGVHALLSQEAALLGPRGKGCESPPLAEGKSLRHTHRAQCHTSKSPACVLKMLKETEKWVKEIN